jgi:hypothetical protein
MIAVGVWLGLAMLGYGPRASASFLPFATEMPQAGAAESTGGPTDLRDGTDISPTDALKLLQACHCGPERPTQGGAGSGSNSSSGPSGPGAVIVSRPEVAGPSLMTRLRSRERLSIPDPIVEAILDPPRAG